MSDALTVLQRLLTELGEGRAAALCAIVATRGSTPQPTGAIVCVDQSGRMHGSLGGGCVEADVRGRALQLLAEGRSSLLPFDLDFEFGLDEGMICGGHMEVAVCTFRGPSDAASLRRILDGLRAGESATLPLYVEEDGGRVRYGLRLEAPPELVIVGAGHLGRALAVCMMPLGFRIHVIDDRVEYANAERFPPPIHTVVGDIADTLRSWPIVANTYIVIVTRGHKHDERALAAVLNSQAAYIGMIGSRRKVDVVFDDLRREGATQAQLDRVHTPIGVKIGAVTAEEIALSIAAQLVQVRRAEHHRAIEGPFAERDDSAIRGGTE